MKKFKWISYLLVCLLVIFSVDTNTVNAKRKTLKIAKENVKTLLCEKGMTEEMCERLDDEFVEDCAVAGEEDIIVQTVYYEVTDEQTKVISREQCEEKVKQIEMRERAKDTYATLQVVTKEKTTKSGSGYMQMTLA